jgi:hypothetical protein
MENHNLGVRVNCTYEHIYCMIKTNDKPLEDFENDEISRVITVRTTRAVFKYHYNS